MFWNWCFALWVSICNVASSCDRILIETIATSWCSIHKFSGSTLTCYSQLFVCLLNGSECLIMLLQKLFFLIFKFSCLINNSICLIHFMLNSWTICWLVCILSGVKPLLHLLLSNKCLLSCMEKSLIILFFSLLSFFCNLFFD